MTETSKESLHFHSLDEEKKLRIINAAMKVFGEHSYKRAITDEIAYQAGISKGLLFYYFKNKKSLYLYIFQYCADVVETLLKENTSGTDSGIFKLDDFFERMEYGADKKITMMRTYPYILQFVMNAFYSQGEEISEDIVKQTNNIRNLEYIKSFFEGIRYDKFKEDIDPMQIMKMLTWMMEGYMHERQNLHMPLDVDEIMREFHVWKDMFRKFCYKEEFI